MCGLAGEIRFDGSEANLDAVLGMSRSLRARGPDGHGAALRGNVALGHRRLKIIDLSAKGQQPMEDPHLGLTVVFNGCIYNYRDLRRELIGEGYRFFSSSDTEIILKAYHAWGPDCVTRFNGMFAFAVHERATGRLVLARDRLGIKPLYYAEDPSGHWLRFASSLPALLETDGIDRSLDPVALHHYMTFHAVVPAPFTMLKGVRKLPPACLRIYEPDGRVHQQTYWELQFAPTAEDISRPRAEWKSMLRESLARSVARRTEADVPVGVLLSGGLDSSLIVGMLAEHSAETPSTFSIGFESVNGEEGDEFRYSDLIARTFATDHHRLEIPSERLLDALPDTISAMSEPMVSHDNPAFYLLSKEVARHVRVVQSGQGADEVFAGYHWYPPLVETNNLIDDYADAFFDRDHDEMCDLLDDRFTERDVSRDFVSAEFERAGADRPIDRALRLDQTVMLVDDPVKRVDNMTMAWGLEARVPFLDHELVELAARIPAEHKLHDGGKGVLKDLARDLIPSDVIDRPKGYFPVPALKYLRGRYFELVSDTLSSRACRERNVFRRDYIDRLMDDPDAHITPLRGSKLWQAGLLEAWLQTNGI